MLYNWCEKGIRQFFNIRSLLSLFVGVWLFTFHELNHEKSYNLSATKKIGNRKKVTTLSDSPAIFLDVEFVREGLELVVTKLNTEFAQNLLEFLSHDEASVVGIHVSELHAQPLPHVVDLGPQVVLQHV